MTDIDKERQRPEFEAWAAKDGFDLKRAGVSRNGCFRGAYYEDDTCGAWSAWLAARASATPPAAEPDDTYWSDKRKLAAPAVQAVGEPSEIDFLEEWLTMAAEPIGLVCCGRSNGPNCCGNPECEYPHPKDVLNAMNERHAKLVADLAIQPPPSAEPAPTDPRQVVGIVDERYLRPTDGGEG